MKIKLLLFALLSLSTLVGFSQVDTIIVTPNSPTYLLLQYPDSLGFNAKVAVRQPAPGNPIYECGFPNVTLESSMTPIAIAIVYSDDAATQWLSTQFLFNLPYNGDSLEFCLNYVGDCNCFIDPMYDTDGDGIICDTMWNSTPDTIPNDIVAAWIYKLQCTDGVYESTKPKVTVYPSPATDLVTVVSPINTGFVKIYSADGKSVMHTNFYSPTFTLNTYALDNGSYIMQIYDTNGESMFHRFVK